MKSLNEFSKRYVFPKVKFGLTSLIATSIDLSIFMFLTNMLHFDQVKAHFISAPIGMTVNFILQKTFIFTLNRSLKKAFVLSLVFSLIGIGLGALIIKYLTTFAFFAEYEFITKCTSILIVFAYNFYTKQFVFENKLKL